MKGKLITLEGIDGAGKSTVLDFLKNHPVFGKAVFTREPTTNWTGEAVERAINSDTDPMAELLLFTADHADHIARVIRPSILEGKNVISDRYYDSRIAYQTVTLQGVLDDPAEWIQKLHQGWTIEPDLTLLLDLDPAVAVSRCNTREVQTKFEKIDFLNKVRRNFLDLAEKQPERFCVIDASQDVEDVKKQITEALTGLF
ncbi:dTMP kinase [Methanohalophilus levihalophilus]|uniref:dTMP kinase n=1 Tax=Methanohalophilus levihalophilus TaxID=1431282 RepID=UPI001AE698E7|nr:dTMP kinase [Methanohalophilus levihalophilus]MBP2029861.1 dTMP kinase [Methanohalophilus levihalophilus]